MKKNNNYTLLLVIMIMINNSIVFSQASMIQWQRSFGGTDIDQANVIKQTTDGGYIIAGNTQSSDGDIQYHYGSVDSWIVKINSKGDKIWQKSLGESKDDYLNSAQQTLDGGYILAGWASSNTNEFAGNHGNHDAWIVKIDENGNRLWQKCLGGSKDDYAVTIQQTADGGYAVAGYSSSTDGDVKLNHGGNDFWFVKLNEQGEIQWQKCFGGTDDDRAYSLQQTLDGGYIIVGWSASSDGDISTNHNAKNYDYWIVRIDEFGNIKWQKSFGGTGSDVAKSVQQTLDGGFIVAGTTSSDDGDVSGNHGNGDYWVVKIDKNGNKQWQQCYGGSSWDQAYGIQKTIDGGYVLSGNSNSNDGEVTGNHGNNDFWIVKIDENGNKQWQKSLGGKGCEYGTSSIQQTIDGGFVLAGSSASSDGDVSVNHNKNFDFWIVKLSETSDGINSGSFSANDIKLYPNPLGEKLNIVSAQPLCGTLYIYNSAGAMVKSCSLKNNSNVQLETIDLQQGFYSVMLQNSSGVKFLGKLSSVHNAP